jgi:serine/threonine protein phosphatase PrpC
MFSLKSEGGMMDHLFLVEATSQTDIGRVREVNEDNLLAFVPEDRGVLEDKGALFVVADGLGGHALGEVASQIAVDTVRSVYYHVAHDDPAWLLKHALERANAEVYQRSQQEMLAGNKEMGTTCLAAVLREKIAYIANVGDGRTYLIRAGQIEQVTRDHSWVAEQVLAGALTEEEARAHEKRNIITRCMGIHAEVEVDIFEEVLQEGDTLLLCTDGLSSLLQKEEMLRIIEQYGPQECVPHLIERANELGGFDNITAIVTTVHE